MPCQNKVFSSSSIPVNLPVSSINNFIDQSFVTLTGKRGQRLRARFLLLTEHRSADAAAEIVAEIFVAEVLAAQPSCSRWLLAGYKFRDPNFTQLLVLRTRVKADTALRCVRPALRHRAVACHVGRLLSPPLPIIVLSSVFKQTPKREILLI